MLKPVKIASVNSANSLTLYSHRHDTRSLILNDSPERFFIKLTVNWNHQTSGFSPTKPFYPFQLQLKTFQDT